MSKFPRCADPRTSAPTGFDQLSRSRAPFHAENAVFAPRELVIIHEKFFQFVLEFLAEIVYRLDIRPTVSVLLDGDDSIITLPSSCCAFQSARLRSPQSGDR